LTNLEDTIISVSQKGSKGIFTNVNAAVAAAKAAQEAFVDSTIKTRDKIIQAFKDSFTPLLDYITEEIAEETGMNAKEAKVAKPKNALYY
jgi:propionaldehyde dehydrogenase